MLPNYQQATLWIMKVVVVKLLKATASKFHKMRESKFGKLKGSNLSDVSLVFQSWLKDTRTHIKDCQPIQKEAVQLVKDSTANHSQVEVEFYLGIEEESQKNFEGLFQHLAYALQLEGN